MFIRSFLSNFIYFFVCSDADYNNHHRRFGTAKLIYNTQTSRAEFDFQKSGKISTAVITKRFSITLFFNRQWILLNFFDGLQNKNTLTSI